MVINHENLRFLPLSKQKIIYSPNSSEYTNECQMMNFIYAKYLHILSQLIKFVPNICIRKKMFDTIVATCLEYFTHFHVVLPLIPFIPSVFIHLSTEL